MMRPPYLLLFALVLDCKGCSGPADKGDAATGAEGWSGDAGAAPPSATKFDDAHGKPVEACSDGRTMCARLEDGKVACWGDLTSNYGAPQDRPVLSPIEHATQLDCSSGTCALLADSRVQCLGPLDAPQLGSMLVPDAVQLSRRCARLKDGRVACQDEEKPTAPWPIVQGIADATALHATDEFACARLRDSTIKCWGQLKWLDLPAGRSPPTVVPMETLRKQEWLAFSLGYRGPCRWMANRIFDCSAGKRGTDVVAEIPRIVDVTTSCALDASGEVFCFDGTKRLDVGIHDAVSLVHGTGPDCALRRGGELTCWGTAQPAVLGRGDAIRSTPVAVAGITDAIGLATGPRSTCVARSSGAVSCWGAIAQDGGLATIAGIDDATEVSVEDEHGCAVTRSREVKCFGQDDGRGPAASPNPLEASPVALPRHATGIVTGEGFSCALMEDETVMCWGRNREGELGLATTGPRETPADVPGLVHVKALTASFENVCALDAGGAVWCWGAVHHYPKNATSPRPVDDPGPSPVHIRVLDGATSLSLGSYGFGAVVAPSGDARMFQLSGQDSGGGQWTLHGEPVPPVAIHDAVELATGADRLLCARSKAGVVRCAGGNEHGQLGDGTRIGRWDAKEVLGLGATDQLAGGASHACARVGGGVLCWGDDTEGAVSARPKWAKPAPVAF